MPTGTSIGAARSRAGCTLVPRCIDHDVSLQTCPGLSCGIMLALAFPLADRNQLVWKNVLSQLNIPQDFGYIEWNVVWWDGLTWVSLIVTHWNF